MSVKCILTEQISNEGGGGVEVSLLKIEVTTPPTKTSYLSGESFDPTGMVVTASYGFNDTVLTTSEVTGYTVSPNVLTDDVTEVTITYNEYNKICTTTQSVSITAIVQSISPYKGDGIEIGTYEYGDTFAENFPARAYYSDGSTDIVVATCSNINLTNVGSHDIGLSYTENGVMVTTTLTIDVQRKKVPKPVLKSNYATNIGAYTGNRYDINNATYLDNYSSLYYSVTGNAAVTAGSYTMTCTPTDNYRWDDESVTSIDIIWKIEKADRIVNVSPTTLEIDANNLIKTATATVSAGGGIWSLSPSTIMGFLLSIDNVGNISVTGNGITVVDAATVTIIIGEDTNYKSASTTLTVSAVYWSWGDESAIGDAAWWNGLKEWIVDPATTASERETCIGKKKKVSLSEPVLGANAASMICIGADQDGNNTLTFQAEYTLPNTTVFSSSVPLWDGSTVQSLCNDFGNQCSANASLKSVTKLTSSYSNDSQDNPANVETTAKCWIPSECEMGFTSGTGYASSYEEWTKGGKEIPYQYYINNENRIKNKSKADGTNSGNTSRYWERSRYYNEVHSERICIVDADGNAYYNDYGYSSNSLAPAFVVGETAQPYADWGDESAIGDESWWNNLKTWVIDPNTTAEQRLACVGKKKKVSLSEPILETNIVSMLCIGADQDGVNTLTFQSEGFIPAFDVVTSNVWDGSPAQTLCNTFGEKCSASISLKSITKLTCDVFGNDSQDNPAEVETTAKCWIPSCIEMGDIGRSPSDKEYTKDISDPKPYSYYSNAAKRIKYPTNSDGTLKEDFYGVSNNYWTRSGDYWHNTSGWASLVNGRNGEIDSNPGGTSVGHFAPAFVIGSNNT